MNLRLQVTWTNNFWEQPWQHHSTRVVINEKCRLLCGYSVHHSYLSPTKYLANTESNCASLEVLHCSISSSTWSRAVSRAVTITDLPSWTSPSSPREHGRPQSAQHFLGLHTRFPQRAKWSALLFIHPHNLFDTLSLFHRT
jgi:hypothetical protein